MKGIVFDLDDTLYSQKDYKKSGFKEIAKWAETHLDIDYELVLNKLYRIMEIQGPSYHYMFNDLVHELQLSNGLVEKMVELFVSHKPEIRCFPGVMDMLTRLRNEFKIGILTDGPAAVQLKKITALNLVDYVDEILYSDILGLEKPSGQLYQWFENKFNLPGEKLIYVGDNPIKDFYGARKRKWTTVQILYGEYLNKAVEDIYRPDVRLTSILEVEKWIQHNK